MSIEQFIKDNLVPQDSATKAFLEQIAYEEANKDWIEKSELFCLDVKKKLRALEMSQAALAEKLGVSNQTLNKWLSGKENLTLKTIVEIEKALNTRFTAYGLELSDPEWLKHYNDGTLLELGKKRNGLKNKQLVETIHEQITFI